MGIQGLNDYIYNHREYFLDSHKLHDTWLIVDGMNISNEMLSKTRLKNEDLGGNYDSYGWQVKQFYLTLKSCKIRPIVILDGISKDLKAYVHKYSEAEKQNLVMRKKILQPLLLPEVFRDITREMGVPLVRPMHEADDTIAALAKALDCPVLSCDTDFFLYGVKFIPYRTVIRQSKEYPGGCAISCQIYNTDKLLKKFQGLQESLLPLALELLRKKNFRWEDWKKFYQTVAPWPKYTIPAILSWLSNFSSVNEAVGALLRYIRVDLRQEIVERLEKNISRFSIASESTVQFLNLDEDVLDHLKEMKNVQCFVFQRRVGMPRVMAVKVREKDTGKLENEEIEESQVTGEQLIAAAPDWLYRDFVTGVLRGTVTKLFVHYYQVSKLKSDSATFPPVREADVPFIRTMFQLITSSMEDEEYLLRVHIRDDDNKVRDVNVKKWPVDLREVRGSAVCERLKIINDVLDIKEEILEKLPEKWRLYVATIIYWKRQKYEFRGTDVHLLSLLFMMLFGIVDDKIGFKRPADRDQCGEELGDYNFHENDEQSELNDETINGYSKSMNIVNSVTKEDCVAAAGFFRSHSMMTDDEFERLPDDWVNFVNTFRQFQRSLVFAIQLNTLLGYPYTSPPIHELYSCTLLYNVFVEFSKAKNIDHYMERKLKNSPGLVSILKLLKRTVLHELEVPESRTFFSFYIALYVLLIVISFISITIIFDLF